MLRKAITNPVFTSTRRFLSVKVGDKVPISYLKGILIRISLLYNLIILYYYYYYYYCFLHYHYSFIYYCVDQKDPIIKDDKEYPDWIYSLHIKGADKLTLINKLNTNENDLTMEEVRRLKRLITLDGIREANTLKGASDSGM